MGEDSKVTEIPKTEPVIVKMPRCPNCKREIGDFDSRVVKIREFAALMLWCPHDDCQTFISMNVVGELMPPEETRPPKDGPRIIPGVAGWNPTRRH